MRTMRLTAMVALAACANDTLPGDTDGNGKGEPAYGGGCDDATQVFGFTDTTPLGITAEEATADVIGGHDEVAAWAFDEAQTVGIHVEAALGSGDVVFHDLEVAEGTGTGMATGAYPLCEDYLEIPVTAVFTTDDGSFDQEIVGSIAVRGSGGASLYGEVDLDAVGGTWTPRPEDTWEWDSATVQFANTWNGDAIQGEITLFAEHTGATVASASIAPQLRWPGT